MNEWKVVEIILKANETPNPHYLVRIKQKDFQRFKEELLKRLKKAWDEFEAFETLKEMLKKYEGEYIDVDEAIYVDDWGNDIDFE